MDIEQDKKRTKKWVLVYLFFGLLSLIAATVSLMFLILTAVFWFIAFLMFKDIKKLDESNVQEVKVQEVVQSNLEEKQINMEVNKMQINMSREEIVQVMAVLGSVENTQLFLKVTDGQMNYAIIEKLKVELETKPKEKAKAVSGAKEELGEEEDKDIIVEED